MDHPKTDVRPNGGQPGKPQEPQRHHDVITATMQAELARAARELPNVLDNGIRAVDLTDKLNKQAQEQIKKIEERELAIARLKTEIVEMGSSLRAAQEEFTFKNDDLNNLIKQTHQMNEALKREIELESPKKPWNWKRITWALASAAMGATTAFLLRKRAPVLNMAAGACGAANLAKKVDVLKNHSMIFGAGGGLVSRWAHDNDNAVGLSVECAMAGGAWGELYFNLGEKGVQLSGEAVKAFKEGYVKATESLKDEEDVA